MSDTGDVDGKGSVSFDRATEYYDETRGSLPETMAAVTALLRDQLVGRGPCLEIGVGTGRIALPLQQEGIEMVGIDLSEAMLHKLVEKSGPAPPVWIAASDATRLPFADDSFGSALAVHVLHLVADRDAVLRETIRVVRPHGVLVVDIGGWHFGEMGEIHRRFAHEAGIAMHPPSEEAGAELDAAMAALGASVRVLPPLTEARVRTYEELIGALEQGLYSFTWKADEEVRRAAAQRTRAWAQERFGELDRDCRYEVQITLRAYDLP